MSKDIVDVAIVTHQALPLGAPDDRLLASSLVAKGLRVGFSPWDSPDVDWGLAPQTVVRSCWDYHLRPASWRSWIDRVSARTRLHNDARLLHWNTDKAYLLALSRHGINCVPTILLDEQSVGDLPAILQSRGWTEIVVKPTVSASARGARRFSVDAELGLANGHASELAASGGVLVQPYVREIETDLERSLVFIGGVFSHAYTKPGFSADALGTTAIAGHSPSRPEARTAAAALEALPLRPVYARVDLVPSRVGPLVMEVELIEPDLGLRLHEPAVQQLADVIAAGGV